ncbi:MAG TPA: Stk1 family PASTA domain-containing Ser/Thr kinase [Actinomycetota bacterium]|nr:Stk1 family PASTA domain-containing Ser/Thr kinase [Actinomycetota bacterium]
MSQARPKRVLAGRYEIGSLLGQGGMARVFKGTDRVLDRTVAIKVLSPQFADDEQFVSRFRREAQAAAGLSHANIVGVFDTGDQGDVHFIVMEYIEGRTLRDVIRGEGPLMPERAAEIGEAVARALSSAHQTGLVHRDIKPGNIMLTRDGQVKVMDFGIARTSTGDTLTQTAAVLGTASYLSPEQAQGLTVDARSDIYSLGCVLFEMLTGRPPFAGDSPVAIAYKHVKEDPVPPSRLNPDVTDSLDAVVLKCMAKNPANRYETAAELGADLERARRGLPTLATPVMAGDTTEVVTRSAGPGETAVMTGLPPEEEEEEEGRRRGWLVALGVILALAALGLAAFFLVRALLPPPAEFARVPNVVGQPEDEAIDTLEDAGFQVPEPEREFDPRVRRGLVISQDPPADQRVEEGTEVTLVISRGPPPEPVPNVVGMTQEEAEVRLQSAGFEVGEVTSEESEEDEGIVLEQDPPAGEDARPGTAVNLVVSSGPATVAVPDVLCQDLGSAEQELAEAELDMVVTGTRFSDECEPGTVAEQNPSAGTEVQPGSNVRVKESEGPEPEPEPTITIPIPGEGTDGG